MLEWATAPRSRVGSSVDAEDHTARAVSAERTWMVCDYRSVSPLAAVPGLLAVAPNRRGVINRDRKVLREVRARGGHGAQPAVEAGLVGSLNERTARVGKVLHEIVSDWPGRRAARCCAPIA
jgi:hypothetical protein